MQLIIALYEILCILIISKKTQKLLLDIIYIA